MDDPSNTLESYGWSARWAERVKSVLSRAGGGAEPGRVVAEHGELLRVRIESAEIEARIAGSLKHEALDRRDLPTVGDWVLVDAVATGSGRIRAILPRLSVFVRKAAGAAIEPQVVAANVDVVAIVSAFGRDVNPRRVERYLAIAWESGARPLIVLSKLDLAHEAAEQLGEIESVAGGVPVFSISNETGAGVDELAAAIPPGQTVALLGSSGVGKSTLLNRLAGRDVLRTGRIRESDGRGRHTTSHRQLVRTDAGLLLIDTPGMREIQPWTADGAGQVFEEVEELAQSCRFGDCAHDTEPGCALRTAVDRGDLDSERLAGYLKLRRESARLERSKDERGRLDEKRFTKMIHRALRDHPKYNR